MDPVLVEVTRGGRVESKHSGAAVVMDADGGTVFAAGDIAQAVYPRSAVKAMLALPLVETGAADRLGLTEAEIALACSSHSGESFHVAAAESMLRKAGRDVSCLECGTHWPSSEEAARALARIGHEPSALHNNCSGKHSGFVCLACDQGLDPTGYVKPEHPAMREITAALADLTGCVLDEHNRAIDGCSIPTFAIPLAALAHCFARFGTGQGLAPERAAATRRIRSAVAANPIMIAGTGRFGTKLMTLLGARVFVKSGAEGVYCAAIPEAGLGIAVKCDDGAGRAAEIAMAALVARFLPNNGAVIPELAAMTAKELRNWNGIHVGDLRPAAALV